MTVTRSLVLSELLSGPVIDAAKTELVLRCRDDWNRLGQAHILLTGGTGFFGSWIIASFAALREAGFKIDLTVLSRNPDRFLEKNPSLKTLPGLTFKKGDVVTATIPFSVTHIFHFATTPASRSDASAEAEMLETIVAGTKRMLEEAERVGTKRFLLASSGAVYGKGNSDLPFEGLVDASLLPAMKDLADPLNGGLSMYGAAKREAERLCYEAQKARRVETVIARGFAFSGPLFPIEGPYAISGFMSAMLNGLPLNVRSPETVRAYLDGRDLVQALWLLLARGRSGEAYNVGGLESVNMHELADLIRAVALKVGRKVPEVRVAGHMMQGSDTYRPSLKKLESEFGWKPVVSLRESLRDHALWAVDRAAVSPS